MKCQKCGTEFENAKFCPECGTPVNISNAADEQPQSTQTVQPAKEKTPFFKNRNFWIIAGIVVIVFLIIIAVFKPKNDNPAPVPDGSTVAADKDTSTTVENKATEKATSAATESKPTDKSYYTIGESCTLNNITATVTDCEVFNYENRFVEKKDGYIYIKVNVKLENNSDKDQSLGSANFECYADNQSIDDSVLVSQDDYLKAFDKISPGRYISGAIYYEIPQGSDVELEFSSDWVAKKNKAIFKLDY